MANGFIMAKNQRNHHGPECPACGCRHLPVSRTKEGAGPYVIRVRNCRNCGRKVITKEETIG